MLRGAHRHALFRPCRPAVARVAPLAAANGFSRAKSGGAVDFTAPDVGLDGDTLMLLRTAQDFAASELAPHAAAWDEGHVFPVDQLRALAGLGFAGLFVREQFGGTGLTRSDGAVIFEALSAGCTSTTACVRACVRACACVRCVIMFLRASSE